jgi:hypothetical protein
MARNRRPVLSSFVFVLGSLVVAASSAAQVPDNAVALAGAPPEAQAATPAPSSTPAAPAPLSRAPFVNRANEALPSWLRLRAEFRERFEGFRGAGFTGGRDDAYALTRLRVNAAVTAGRYVSFQANVHDARLSGKTIGSTGAPFRGPLDLRTGFVDVGDAKTPVAVRLGRQELAFGEQRLIGHLAWVNTGRSFNAARLTLRSKAVTADVIAASLVRNLPDRFDRSGNGNRLAGVYASSTAVIPRAVVEPFVLVRRDVNLRSERLALGTLLQTTTGARIAGKLPAGFDYGVEMALQRGSLGTDDIRAWAGHWQLRSLLPGRLGKKVTAEYNYATGDADATDGRRRTFDQLYPTGHDKLGLGDQVGWRNVHHLRQGFELTPFNGTPISIDYHTWWLAERADGLYAATGALIARVPGGAASRHVGHELDLQVSRMLTPQLHLAAGYAHMFAGAFLKEATPGASFSSPFVMLTYVLLADK